MFRRISLLLWSGALVASPAVWAEPVIDQLGEPVERHLSDERPLTQWSHDPAALENEASDRLETREVADEKLETVKLTGVVPAIHFESGVADIPAGYVERLGKILDGMRDRRNVRLHFVGHADSQPLSDSLTRVYGDNSGLSRERAGEVAEFFKHALALPPESISFEWVGDTRPIASNATADGRAQNRRVEVEVWYDQPVASVREQEVLVTEDFKRVKVCRIETVCKLRYVEGHERRARVRNLVAPLHYETETVDVPEEFTRQVGQALENLRDKQNVRVKFIGFTDDAPLSARAESIYGDHLALSKARAHRVALAVEEGLDLPSSIVESDGRGTALSLGPNDTPRGRAMNRRVEVELWYDDPLQELPDEPQLCPADAGDRVVTKVYDPPWGAIEPLQLEAGRAVIPAGYTDVLRHALKDLDGRTNVRLRFIGYTANERLDRRTALVYGDDIGLSAARARRAMEAVTEQMGLPKAEAEHEGRGFVQSDDVVNLGFVQGEKSFVRVQAVYDELAPLDDYDGVDVTKLTRELSPKSPYELNLMRITVDGEPIDDPARSSADIQRCTDVAFDKANIEFRFDNLESRPRLSVAATPATVELVDGGDGQLTSAEPVRFRTYANYGSFIERFEVRILEHGQSVQSTPLQVLEVDHAGSAEWQPVAERFRAPVRELEYVVRAYDAKGNFDETSPQPLWLVHGPASTSEPPTDAAKSSDAATEPDTAEKAGEPMEPDAAQEAAAQVESSESAEANASSDVAEASSAALETAASGEATESSADTAESAAAPGPENLEPQAERQLLAAYGESALAIRNIPLGSGTIKVRGSGVPTGHNVWIAGQQVPVDPQGNFAAEAILPTGTQSVEVAMLDADGNGQLFLRDLELKRKDWFYVGVADLTVSENSTNGPAELLQGANAPQDFDSTFDGRFAFYVNGKFGEHWKLTASADTREGPIEDLFSNMLDKSPDSLFRRIDPDYHYPTFGDDATVDEMAPTMGKFYVKLSEGENHGLWGNFRVGYMENELAQVDRGLYGANAHLESESSTSFGEERYAVDAFAAEPGTVSSYEEFRGTGGSLYFLRRQDILAGSESVRIELRDKDSQTVTGVVNLRPALDYDIDYLQGRVLLSEPLSSTAEDNLLVRSGGVSGDEAYLVVRYEYSPGFNEIDAVAAGGQGHVWLNDHFKLGLTSSANDDGDQDSNLQAADLTMRLTSESWLKVQTGRSEGLVSTALRSDDGGYDFYGDGVTGFTDANADAYRVDLSVGLGDLLAARKGRVTLYAQTLGAGYSAPGLASLNDTDTFGGTFTMPITDRFAVKAKGDRRVQEQGLETTAQELNLGYQFTRGWSVSTGVRNDSRKDLSPIVPVTQEQGDRTDGVVQVQYDSGAAWSAYSFVQDTLSKSEQRESNGRIGTGGAYRFGERFKLDGEISDGDLGVGGRLGTNYLLNEKTNLYLNYSLENERTDNGLYARRGNVISGVKRRFSDATSVYLEERYQDTESIEGLTHATGLNLVANERWNLGANADFGTLQDSRTGAETDRKAGGIRVGYGRDSIQLSSAIEYRVDEAEQPDATVIERKTWLFRNNFKYQLTPDWRLIGKLNHSLSDSTQGDFYDGGYTEAVMGYAYRPVDNDRLNALAKYTYFFNVPTTDQFTLQNLPAEFIQKSHIAALDVSYDLTRAWSVGGKYAYRLGQISLDREDREFFDNSAQLVIVRTDWRFRENWESMVEARTLDLPDVDQRRSGALVAIYRYLGEHFKVGAGYNFTDFSDDLTDLSYDHEGVFINMIGSM
jgi:flagellar motor protein MotB